MDLTAYRYVFTIGGRGHAYMRQNTKRQRLLRATLRDFGLTRLTSACAGTGDTVFSPPPISKLSLLYLYAVLRGSHFLDGLVGLRHFAAGDDEAATPSLLTAARNALREKAMVRHTSIIAPLRGSSLRVAGGGEGGVSVKHLSITCSIAMTYPLMIDMDRAAHITAPHSRILRALRRGGACVIAIDDLRRLLANTSLSYRRHRVAT